MMLILLLFIKSILLIYIVLFIYMVYISVVSVDANPWRVELIQWYLVKASINAADISYNLLLISHPDYYDDNYTCTHPYRLIYRYIEGTSDDISTIYRPLHDQFLHAPPSTQYRVSVPLPTWYQSSYRNISCSIYIKAVTMISMMGLDVYRSQVLSCTIFVQ